MTELDRTLMAHGVFIFFIQQLELLKRNRPEVWTAVSDNIMKHSLSRDEIHFTISKAYNECCGALPDIDIDESQKQEDSVKH